jgi:CARDB
VDAGDFSLATSGVTGASIASVTGGGATYTVSVNTGSGNGTLGMNLVDNDSIVNPSGTQLGGAGAGNGNFTGQIYTIDKTAPEAGSLVAANVTTGGGTTHSFTIVFSDNLAIDITSLDGSDIGVSGPGGFNQLAAFISVNPPGNGTPRTATYSITARGGSWDSADNGVYTVVLQANQVLDTAGNPVAGQVLGMFTVNVSTTIRTVFLPMVQIPGTPDLVIIGISLVPSKTAFVAGEGVEVRVTVTNQGTGVATAFWLDLYINPSAPPTAANQIWNTRCGMTPCFGMAWEVTSGLAPGQSVTLSSLSLPAGYSIWPGYFAAGTTDLYAYADSYNPSVVAGAVAESNETNNRAELHGLSVTGPNPVLVGMQGVKDLLSRQVHVRK